MSDNRDLLVFGEDWGAHPSSTQHLVSRLAADRRVLWINSIGLRRPRLQARDVFRIGHKLAAMTGLPDTFGAIAREHHPTNLNLLAPRALCWPGSGLVSRINKSILGGQIKKALGDSNIARPIIWASLPTAIDVVGDINRYALVYYCGDDFSALSGVDHEPVARMEQKLAAQADLTIAASDVLASRFQTHKTILAPHGVDYDLFAMPAPRAKDLPQGRPIAGFYGALADWIDVPMIASAAYTMSDWDFVLIGPVQTDISALSRLKNVHILGPRPHAALPSYSQHWSVSILPFRDNAQIRACNPLKLREYLAAGTLIASTPFTALNSYKELVHIVNDNQTLPLHLRAAASDVQRSQERRARVRNESWESRASDISSVLAKL